MKINCPFSSFHTVACCFLFIGSLFFVPSCSSEKLSEIEGRKNTESGKVSKASETSQVDHSTAGGSIALEIAPKEASRNSTLSLIPIGFDFPEAKIEWMVDGRPVASPQPNLLKAAEITKGSLVQAKASVRGREILSNSIEIKNAPPEISRIKILPEVFKPGDTLSIEVSGSDIDGDAVGFVYEWTNNGEPAGSSERIEGQIKRGDTVSVKVTPFDREERGRQVILFREIRNMPPMIIENKVFSLEGNTYTYQVRASDPDGDPLTYKLLSAPSGMSINASTGLITWPVPAEFKGKKNVSIGVNDDHDGTARYDLEITIK